MESLKIYLRSENKIYLFYENEIYFYENQELSNVLENFLEENSFDKTELKKNMEVSFILHFSYFNFENFKNFENYKEEKNKNKKKNNYEEDKNENKEENEKENKNKNYETKKIFKNNKFVCKKFILDYVNDEYLNLYLEKNKISRLKKIVKNYFLKISEIKIDFQAIYNFYKNKNLEFESKSQNQNQKENKNNYEEEKNKEENLFFENQKENKNQKEDEEIKIVQIEDIGVEQTIDKESLENENLKSEKIEIFQIGEENSLRMVIFDEKITELEKVELRLSDIGEISEFDFGDMIVFTDTEEEIKMIFSGSELFETPNFAENESFFDAKSLKEIKILDVATVLFLFLGYFLLSNFMNNEKLKKENENIKVQTKILEKNYLKKKDEEIPDYTKELKILKDIDNSIERDEFYSYIKFLVENSKKGVDYTKINYENSKWTVSGELKNFENFEKFENSILKKYPNSELGYLKDNDEATMFEYVIK